jgi:AcrR family transcriptional regulator
MTKDVNRRAYHSPRRAAAAATTRQAILTAARSEFLRNGYTATTIAGIARAADVAVDTVYASVGRKPALLRQLIETSIAGQDQAVPVGEGESVRQIRSMATASDKIEVYASTIAAIHQRLAPLFLALREAATANPELGELWAQVADRRARNMRELATDLVATGELRAGLTLDEVADVLWSMNAAEYYILLVHDRGWSPQRFGRWLAEAWRRLLVTPSGPTPPAGATLTDRARERDDQHFDFHRRQRS